MQSTSVFAKDATKVVARTNADNGFSVVKLCDSSGNETTLFLEGDDHWNRAKRIASDIAPTDWVFDFTTDRCAYYKPHVATV